MDGVSPTTSTNGISKFPAFNASEASHEGSSFRYPSSSPSRTTDGVSESERWQPRRLSRAQRPNGSAYHPSPSGKGHGRQKSLSEAIRTIRTRSGSVSQNAHELADALKAPVSPRLVLLCALWYGTSMMANTSAGQILNTFPKPITLTVIQFFCVSLWCLFLSWLAKQYPMLKDYIPALRNGIQKPSRALIHSTLPLTGFMIGGHILTSDAMSRIPVSLVHTIKGLTPLITVAAYRFIFHIHYSHATYLSLIPLTVGVVMACSTNLSGNFLGLLSAFASAILFVTQNIVSKKLFNEAAAAELDGGYKTRKPDKLNLLCYSSALALAFTLPLWLWVEGFTIIADLLHDASIDLSGKKDSLDHGRLALEYLFNGSFHFAQSLVAFTLLAMVSPVTYSVASLIKRVFVICFAIVWFGNKVTGLQGVGIVLTFLGLYLYDRTSDANRADRRARLLQLNQPSLLPLHEKPFESPNYTESPMTYGNGPGPNAEEKKRDTPDRRRPDAMGNGWLPPGTKAEETWTKGDIINGQPVSVS